MYIIYLIRTQITIAHWTSRTRYMYSHVHTGTCAIIHKRDFLRIVSGSMIVHLILFLWQLFKCAFEDTGHSGHMVTYKTLQPASQSEQCHDVKL